MVKVKFGAEQYEAMKKFEARHHADIWNLIMSKIGKSDGLKILDVSEEACVFALTLAENHPTNRLIISSVGDKPTFDLPSNVDYHKGDIQKDTNSIAQLGPFDLILVNEISHDISDFDAFFKTLKTLLSDAGQIVIFSRPKNPPLPVPDVCLVLWRKLMCTKEEILAAANQAQLNSACFSVAVPISADKVQWENILYSGCFPAVKNTPKCDEKVIRDFVVSKNGKFDFEEKLLVVMLRK
ncbi:unnamed protein product [Caenorhabditis angaria]|uniref:Uncharacterized protein n=1 Tax=Caenorhabditis angaria TaxID=860376 RepID=A0A9P1ITX2_9PELO|nr:unnamed protein product [Caenorhabditis angaria]